MTSQATSETSGTAASRTLRFVNAAADAKGDRSSAIVVLDTSWTPLPGQRDRLPLRPTLLKVLDAEDLFLRSLSLLDAWAEACGLPDRFARDGATWWFHARSFVRLDLQELLLWGRVLEELAPPGAYDTVMVPRDRPLLAEAVRAGAGEDGGPQARLTGGTGFASSDLSGKPALAVNKRRRRLRAVRLVRRGAQRILVVLGLREAPVGRLGILRARLDRLAAGPRPTLAIVRAPSFHHVESDTGLVRRDPYVGPVTERLEGTVGPTAMLALALHHRMRDDWEFLEADPRLIPYSLMRSLQPDGEDKRLAGYEAEATARLATLPSTPVRDGFRDFGPALRATVAGLGHWLALQWRDIDRADTLFDILRPHAVLTGWEAARTSWIGTARRHGIPSFAIQHGVIYPDTPDYCRPASPLLVKPDVTCVYGPYEKDILVREGGYADEAVLVSGSPRVDLDQLSAPFTREDRDAVRIEVGVAAGDRMLVLSGGRMTVGDRLGTLPLLGRVLRGPLPGVHLVVKLHPEENDGDPYRLLFAGQAAADGYPPPPVTVIRDIDLYRLLRAADAHLGVFSTVLTDSVLAGTPNMIVVGQAQADLLGYVDAGVATPVRSVDDVRAFMAEPMPPAADAQRRFIADHYLAGDAVGRVADAIAHADVARHVPG